MIKPFIHNNRGMALLTVVALLSFFAVIGTAFVFTMRLEEQTARNFERTTRIGEVSGLGAEVAAASLAGSFIDPDGIPGSGDEPKYFDSEMDNWYFGFAGSLDQNSHYTALGRVARINPLTVGLPSLKDANSIGDLKNGVANRFYRLGVDEDPPGDLNGDGYPGVAGWDDDGDGYADYEDPDVIAGIIRAAIDPTFIYNPANDDDEDGLSDEDGRDFELPWGEGLDADDDALGVVDESGKLNINWSGNLSFEGYHRHHQGATTFEIDPTMYFIARGVSVNTATQLTRNLVLFRHGLRSAANMGNLNAMAPGLALVDDNGNDNSQILRIDPETLRTDAERVTGDGVDNDGDLLIDEADEFFIGGGPIPGKPVMGANDRLIFGDGIDNDADGDIDEEGEGIDEPAEYHPDVLRGDDTLFDTLEKLRLVPAAAGATFSDTYSGSVTYYQLVKDYLTVYSSARPLNPDLEARRQAIYINLLSNYTPWSDISRPLTLDEILSLQVDNDGDWRAQRDGRRPSDDYNRNGKPDFDWDGSDNSSEIPGDGIDNDGDGRIDEEDADFNQDGLDNYDPEYHLNEDPPGDANGDGYPGIGAGTQLANRLGGNAEDDDGDGLADFDDPEVKRAMSDSRSDGRLNDRLDNNWNHYRWLTDRIDNDFDGLVDETYEYEIAMGFDNPADEGVDEFLLRYADLPQSLRDQLEDRIENVQKYPHRASLQNYPLETYYSSFDDDEDGRMDEDPPEFDLLVHLADNIDQLSLTQRTVLPTGTREQADGVTTLDVPRYNPREVREAYDPDTRTARIGLPDQEAHPEFFVPGGEPNEDGIDSAYNFPPPATEYDRHKGKGPVNHVYEGSEGVFINEVMVRPVIVLQAEHAQLTNIISIYPPYASSEEDDWPSIDPDSNVLDGFFRLQGPHPGGGTYGDGTYYYVFDDPNDYPDPISGLSARGDVFPPPRPEAAQWDFGFDSDIEIPQGAYNIYFYQSMNTVKDRITEATVAISFDGALYTPAYTKVMKWNDEGKPFNLNVDYIQVPGFASAPKRFTVYMEVAANSSPGEFSFDRVELVHRDLQYVELVNYSSRAVDMSDYSIGFQIEREAGIDPIRIGDLRSDSSGPAGDYWINPYGLEEEDPTHLMVIYISKTYMDRAYPGFTNLPPEVGKLQFPSMALNLFGDTTRLYSELIQNATDEADYNPATRVLELYNPAGEIVDSFEISYRVRTGNSCGFLTQQRGNPTEGKYEYDDARGGLGKKRIPRRLYLWDADIMFSDRDNDPDNANDLVGARMEHYWDDDPKYPGQLAFSFADLEKNPQPSGPADRPSQNEHIDAVWFAFNLSRRFPDLDFTETNERYYLDVSMVAAPWAPIDPTTGEPCRIVGYVVVDVTGDLPWAAGAGAGVDAAIAENLGDPADTFLLESGDYWKTVEVVAPDFTSASMNDDTYLVLMIVNPYDPLTELEKMKRIRLLAVDLMDHDQKGPKDTPAVLSLRGGTPGVPSFAPVTGLPLVYDGRFASPGDLWRVAASGPEWILSATDIGQLANRISARYQSDVPGLINVNTAPISVLTALPWLPPRFFGTAPAASLDINLRYEFHALIAHRLVEGRSEFSAAGRNEKDVDDDNDGFIDEGPYEEIGDILRVLRDPWLGTLLERRMAGNPIDPDFRWDVNEQMAAFARVSGLITTRSSVFTATSRGRITELRDRTEQIAIPGKRADDKITAVVAEDTVIKTILRD